MNGKQLTVQAVIDGKTYTEFAVFDVLRRQRRWLRPLLFAAIFTAFSLLAFFRKEKAEQAMLLGWVLLAVGLVLPLAYFLSFYLSVRRQAKKQDGKEAAYTLTLDEAGLTVQKGEQTAQYAWASLEAVYGLRRSICFYPDRIHAFLLPVSDGDKRSEEIWSLIRGHVEPGKIKTKR